MRTGRGAAAPRPCRRKRQFVLPEVSFAACRGVGRKISRWVEDVTVVRTVRGVRGDPSSLPPPFLHTHNITININLAQVRVSIARIRLTGPGRVVDKSARSLPPLLSLPLFSSQLGSFVIVFIVR